MASPEADGQYSFTDDNVGADRLATVSDIVPRITHKPGDELRVQIIDAIRLSDGGVRDAEDFAGRDRIANDVGRLWNDTANGSARIEGAAAVEAFNGSDGMTIYVKNGAKDEWRACPTPINGSGDPEYVRARRMLSGPTISALGKRAMNHDRKGETPVSLMPRRISASPYARLGFSEWIDQAVEAQP